MKINTKNTIKVLSGLALVSTVAGVTTNTADAKTYKPEVRYDNGKYFIKTSDESAKGKSVGFLINQNITSDPYYLYNVIPNYQNQEVEISRMTGLGKEENIEENRLVSIKDSEGSVIPDRELEDISDEEFNKKKSEYYKEVSGGAITIKDAMKKETTSKPQEAPQSSPSDKPEEELKETSQPKPQDRPKTEPKETSQPKPQDGPKTEPKGTPQPETQDGPKTEPKGTPQPKPQDEPKPEPKSKLQEDLNRKTEEGSSTNLQLESQDSGLNIFGQNKDSKKEDESKKQESATLTNFDTKVVSKESVKKLANTGLNTSSYALLVSVVGLLGALALRRKNR